MVENIGVEPIASSLQDLRSSYRELIPHISIQLTNYSRGNCLCKLVGYGTSTRTKIHRIKICCPTLERYRNINKYK